VKDIQVMGTKDTTPLFGGKTREDGMFVTNVTSLTRTITVVISDPSGRFNGDYKTETVPEDQYLYYFNFTLTAKVLLTLLVKDAAGPVSYQTVNLMKNAALLGTEVTDMNGLIRFPTNRGQSLNIGDTILAEVKGSSKYID
jgi:hypothetical protein